MVSIGIKIRELLSQKNIDAVTLAKRLGKSKQAVYDMLDKQDVNTSIIRELSVILDVPIVYFFEEDDEGKENVDLVNDVSFEELQTENIKLRAKVELLRDQVRELSGLAGREKNVG